ncbi:hypothetical protein BH24ACI1_BH24ACI1_25090 [soil metagenome]
MELILRFLLVFLVSYSALVWMTWSLYLSLFLSLVIGIIAFFEGDRFVFFVLRLTKYVR